MNNREQHTIEKQSPFLHRFFTQQLQYMYHAEKRQIKMLTQMEAAATSLELKKLLFSHLSQTRYQLSRLVSVFELIKEEARGTYCSAMAGIGEEAETIIDETTKGTRERYTGLIMAAQKAEHYEIATYDGLVHLATGMGLDEAAKILNNTLAEEQETDAELMKLY